MNVNFLIALVLLCAGIGVYFLNIQEKWRERILNILPAAIAIFTADWIDDLYPLSLFQRFLLVFAVVVLLGLLINILLQRKRHEN